MDFLEIVKKCPKPLIGVDEVGRGCLAGPVCAGAVILNDETSHYCDSKVLTGKRRSLMSRQIQDQHQTAIGYATVEEIDQMNILQASLEACRRAVLNLNVNLNLKRGGTVLIDGKFIIPNFQLFTQVPIIKGDSKVHAISAASIIAKCFRDKWMEDLSKEYPGYGFEKHKGYPTPFHKDSIRKLGPCVIHRKSFSGVKEYVCSL